MGFVDGVRYLLRLADVLRRSYGENVVRVEVDVCDGKVVVFSANGSGGVVEGLFGGFLCSWVSGCSFDKLDISLTSKRRTRSKTVRSGGLVIHMLTTASEVEPRLSVFVRFGCGVIFSPADGGVKATLSVMVKVGGRHRIVSASAVFEEDVSEDEFVGALLDKFSRVAKGVEPVVDPEAVLGCAYRVVKAMVSTPWLFARVGLYDLFP